MQILSEAQTRGALGWTSLITSLHDQFIQGGEVPARQHYHIEGQQQESGALLVMPAWEVGGYVGVKLLNIFPSNNLRGLPSISSAYLLSSASTGELLALVDGGELTARRTAAASALASRYLSKKDSSRLLIVGAGRLSLNLIEAHASVRNLQKVRIWARRFEQAEKIAEKARTLGFDATSCSDLREAVQESDIVCCCTPSRVPLVKGEWLRPGTHLDLVGGYRPDMREVDDEAVRRSVVFVDTIEGATTEAGDIMQPLESGVINLQDISADLFNLTRGVHPGRTSDTQITLFKSVGSALEDLAGAVLAYRHCQAGGDVQQA